MKLWPDLRTRVEAPEYMDDPTSGGRELVEALGQLRWINLVLGAAWPTLEGVARVWRQAGCPAQLSILDVGAGTGDANRLLLRWADLRRIHLHVTLLDLHPDTCTLAADYYRNEPRITVQQGSLFALPPRSVDIVTASLVAHHFPAVQVPVVVQKLAQTARLGVVINDLQRHRLAWLGIWLLTHAFPCNRIVRHDAPLSVRRGFRPADFEEVRALPGMVGLCYWWRPLFRYLLIVPAMQPTEVPVSGAESLSVEEPYA